MTREEMARRRQEIAAMHAAGDTMEIIGDLYAITKQRVSQIVKRVKLDAQRERCRSGVHGKLVTQVCHVWRDGRMVGQRFTWCQDCEQTVEP